MIRGEPVACIDGAFTSEREARVPATSATLLRGLGVFETLRIARGEAPLGEAHRTRLLSSAAELGLPSPSPALDWIALSRELAARNGADEGVVRWTLGDGFALLTFRPLPESLPRELAEGIPLTIAEAARELPSLKTCSRALLETLEQRAGGEVLMSQDGDLLETTRSNVFVCHEGALWTAPPDRVLPGIARAWTLGCARAWGIDVMERAPQRAWLQTAAEVFVTNAVRGPRRVHALDGRSTAGRPDTLCARLQQAFAERITAR